MWIRWVFSTSLSVLPWMPCVALSVLTLSARFWKKDVGLEVQLCWCIQKDCTVWWFAPSLHSERVWIPAVAFLCDSKPSIGVSIWLWMVVCLFCFYVALRLGGDLCRMYPASCPVTAGIGSGCRKRMDGIYDSTHTSLQSFITLLLMRKYCLLASVANAHLQYQNISLSHLSLNGIPAIFPLSLYIFYTTVISPGKILFIHVVPG